MSAPMIDAARRLEGQCLCGRVRLAATVREIDACHCGQCRKWNGGPAFALDSGGAVEVLEGEAHIKTYASSEWAERAFCAECGSGLWYRLTLEGPAKGYTTAMAGLFEGLEAVPFAKEIFVDDQPGWYGFAGERPRLTGAEAVAMFKAG